MNCPFHRLASTVLAALGVFGSFGANIAAETPREIPEWLSEVAVLRSEDAQSFQFRANVDIPSQRANVYVSWAPPHRQAVVVCDGADGLPLMIAVDGNVLMYDLIGGQILRFEADPSFEFRVAGERIKMNWGFKSTEKAGAIRVDFASFFAAAQKPENLQTMANEKGRVAAATVLHSQMVLRATASDPPHPMSFMLEFAEGGRPSRMAFDAFQFGSPLPAWHHGFSAKRLSEDVPYLDAEDPKNLPDDTETHLALFKVIMAAGATFLLRPALRNPDLQRSLAKEVSQLNFQQIEFHEKLLHEAWLRALADQDFAPEKSFPPLPRGWKH